MADRPRAYRLVLQMEGVEDAVQYEIGMHDAIIVQTGYQPLVAKLQGLVPEGVAALLLSSDLREDVTGDE